MLAESTFALHAGLVCALNYNWVAHWLTYLLACVVVKPCSGVVVHKKPISATDCWVSDYSRLRGRWSHVAFLHADVTRSRRVSETWCRASCKYCESSLFVSLVSVTVQSVHC